MGKSITLIDYSSGFPEISEADELNQSYNLPHNDFLTPDKVLFFVVTWFDNINPQPPSPTLLFFHSISTP